MPEVLSPVTARERERILTTAAQLFTTTPPYTTKVSLDSASTRERSGLTKGALPLLTIEALCNEDKRATREKLDRYERANELWNQRTSLQKIKDYLGGITIYGQNLKPDTRIEGEVHRHEYGRIGQLALRDGWPNMSVGAWMWSFEGTLKVAGEVFNVDPNALNVKVGLTYPLSDGSGYDRSIEHTLHAYSDEIRTESERIVGFYWEEVPSQPFANDQPLPAWQVMCHAMDALK